MTEAPKPAGRAESRSRPPGTRAVRPRHAATLIIVRRDGPKARVLMGKRNSGHDFMPNLWVFPGGRIDRADYYAPIAEDLRPEVAATFQAHLPLSKGRALAAAAVRETWEETGLLLAKPVPERPAVGPWREFLDQGYAPDLSAVEIVARAVTPPMLAKRFDTWFLMADAEALVSLDRQPDCGELEEIAWVEFDEAIALPLPMVTRTMISEAVQRMEDPSRPQPYMRFGSKKTKMSFL